MWHCSPHPQGERGVRWHRAFKGALHQSAMGEYTPQLSTYLLTVVLTPLHTRSSNTRPHIPLFAHLGSCVDCEPCSLYLLLDHFSSGRTRH